MEGFLGWKKAKVCGNGERDRRGRLEKIVSLQNGKGELIQLGEKTPFRSTIMTHQRLRVWHLLWGNGRQRPKESTKTRTKLMLEGIGDAYRLLVGLDATCKG